MLCSRVSTGIYEKKYIFPLTNNTRVFCRQRVFLYVKIIGNQSLSELGKSDVVIVYLIRPQAVTAGDRNRVENGDITVERKMSVFIAQNSRVVIPVKTGIFFGNSQYGSPFHAAEIVFFSEITYAEMGGNIVGSI